MIPVHWIYLYIQYFCTQKAMTLFPVNMNAFTLPNNKLNICFSLENIDFLLLSRHPSCSFVTCFFFLLVYLKLYLAHGNFALTTLGLFCCCWYLLLIGRIDFIFSKYIANFTICAKTTKICRDQMQRKHFLFLIFQNLFIVAIYIYWHKFNIYIENTKIKLVNRIFQI